MCWQSLPHRLFSFLFKWYLKITVKNRQFLKNLILVRSSAWVSSQVLRCGCGERCLLCPNMMYFYMHTFISLLIFKVHLLKYCTSVQTQGPCILLEYFHFFLHLFLFQYITEANIMLFTPLHLSESFSHFSDNKFFIPFLYNENCLCPNVVILNTCDKLKD